jgi:RIO kinase 1
VGLVENLDHTTKCLSEIEGSSSSSETSMTLQEESILSTDDENSDRSEDEKGSHELLGMGHGRRKYEDKTIKKERKLYVKLEKREKRTQKVPKHIKKRKEKKGRQSIHPG